MQLPDEAPKLPKLPFLIGDGVFLATAFVIVQRSDVPLAIAPLIAVVACVGIGAVLAIIPLLLDYSRRQEAALTERQNSLEALARTTAASAEQISIAAAGLHTIAELAQENLRAAEQLPHKLQEKINEFNQQRDEAVVAENEALTQEINTLRSSEAEKLETASDRVHKTATDLAKLEAATQKHLAAIGDALARLPSLAEEAGRKASQAVNAASDDAVARLLAEIDARLAAAAGTFAARTAHPFDPPAPAAIPRRVEPAAPSVPTATPASMAAPIAAPPPPPASTTPVASNLASKEEAPTPIAAAASAEGVESAESAGGAVPKPSRKRVPRKEPAASLDEATHADEGEASQLFTDAGADASGAEPIERSLAADGLTRLVVTAYIGIGNRLYVRGDGPGLSREKGVPLQFVSIGKWRWETADANAPVSIKVYKNDQVECAALGAITLDPGQQAEVTAAF